KGDDDNETVSNRNFTTNQTILSGDIGEQGNTADNAYHVIYSDNVSNAIVNGVTITAGNANKFNDGNKHQGGGILNFDGELSLENVSVENNVASSQGGGIWNGGTGVLTLDKVSVKGNSGSSGAGIYSYATFTMNGGEVSGNGSDNNSSGGGFFITND